MFTAARLGLLCAIRENYTWLEKSAKLGIGKTISKSQRKLKKYNKKIPKAVQADPYQPARPQPSMDIQPTNMQPISAYPPPIELINSVPENGPLLHRLGANLGNTLSGLTYHIDPDLQRLLVDLAGGPKNPSTSRNIGLGVPAIAAGLMYGLNNAKEDQPRPNL
jgi:hypothetical protein